MAEDVAELREFLTPYPANVQELTLQGRQVLLDMLSPVHELVFDATSAVCCGFSYTEKTRDVFVNLAVYSDHVTLVFGWGVKLADPEKRLKGEGNQVRNMRLQGLETLKDPYVQSLIMEASEKAARDDEIIPQKIVKVYEGPKRRPKPS